MKLRVFYIVHTDYSHTTKKFKTTRKQEDFPAEMTEKQVKAKLIDQYGEVGRFNGSGTLLPYCEVVSFTRIDDSEPKRGEVDSWRAIENSLLSPEMLKETVSYGPNYRGKR